MYGNKIILMFTVAIALTACNGEQKTDVKKDEIVETPDTIKASQFNISGQLFSVPSPVQTALLVQKSGVSYDKALLNQPSKVNTFNTDFARSLNLGIYGADLGYVSLYNQTQDALSYLGSVKQLADKLGITAAFDSGTIERFQKNISNKDSMMVLVGIAYRSSDAYLKNNKRNDVSSLILAGGWIESLHFSTSAYKQKPNEDIKNRIAQQKQSLTSIIKVLELNKTPEVEALVKELNDLAKVYEGIQFKYVFAEPVTDSIKKLTYINSTTEVTVTSEQITQITSKIAQIRNKIISTQS
ncbi:MAG: hypothetical protein JSU07_10275 [Bacteroidetes bacterium]|nr:hypothetical protein [Bacteroidota bacterium]